MEIANKSALLNGIQAVLLDIEGTTTSISFVKVFTKDTPRNLRIIKSNFPIHISEFWDSEM